MSNLPPRNSVDPSLETAKASTSGFVVATVFRTLGVNVEIMAPVVMSTAMRFATSTLEPLGVMAFLKNPPTNITFPDFASE